MERINYIKTGALVLLACLTIPAMAAGDPLEDYFYASGKIKVVIGVFTIILVGLFAFLITLERRIKNLEKDKKNG